MKTISQSVLVAGLLAMVASACARAPTAPLPNVDVNPSPIPADSGDTVSASVEVQPARSADMAFLIDGRVKDVLVSAGQQVTAGQPLLVLETPQLEYAVVSAQAEADSAQLNETLQGSSRQYKVWNGRRWIWTHGLPEVGRAAEARLEQALGSLAVARSELAQATLLAPYDGTIVAVHLAPGEMASPGEVALVFADLRGMQVVTKDLSERDIAPVRIGQRARMTLKALGGELQGTVVSIDPVAGRSDDGDVIYRITIELDSQRSDLFWGMTGEATISVSSQ